MNQDPIHQAPEAFTPGEWEEFKWLATKHYIGLHTGENEKVLSEIPPTTADQAAHLELLTKKLMGV